MAVDRGEPLALIQRIVEIVVTSRAFPASIAMAHQHACVWPLLLFILDLHPLLLGQPGPGLRHFDQQRFVRLVRGVMSQAQAFGCAPLMILEFGHETLPVRNAGAACSVPLKRESRVWTSRTLARRLTCSQSGGMRIVAGRPRALRQSKCRPAYIVALPCGAWRRSRSLQ